MFGRATITLGIGPHSSLFNISEAVHTGLTVPDKLIRWLLVVQRSTSSCGIMLQQELLDRGYRLTGFASHSFSVT